MSVRFICWNKVSRFCLLHALQMVSAEKLTQSEIHTYTLPKSVHRPCLPNHSKGQKQSAKKKKEYAKFTTHATSSPRYRLSIMIHGNSVGLIIADCPNRIRD